MSCFRCRNLKKKERRPLRSWKQTACFERRKGGKCRGAGKKKKWDPIQLQGGEGERTISLGARGGVFYFDLRAWAKKGTLEQKKMR